MKPRITYRPGVSALHRLHPLIKLAWLVLFTVLVFIFPVLVVPAGLLLGLLAGFAHAGMRLRDLPALRLVLFTALAVAVLQVLFYRHGEPMLVWGAFQPTDEGLVRGLYLGARLLVVVLASFLFVLTTSPNELAYALMRAGLPYRMGFTLVTALRMIPLFEQEAQTIYRAQRVRGVSYTGTSIRTFWNNLKSFFMPLLVSAVRRAAALSISMEGRCFGMHGSRTWYRTRPRSRGDWLAGVLLVLAASAAAVIRIRKG